MALRTRIGSWSVACWLLLAAGCSADDGGAPTPTPRPAEEPSLTLGFTQWGPLVGTDKALLRVENRGETGLHLTGIGLDWPGYGGEFLQAKDSMLAPEQILDLTIDLPEPDCADDSAPVVGIVRVANATDARQELEGSAQAFVRQLWSTTCSRLFVRERLQVEYGDRWTRRGNGTSQTIRGTVELTRRADDEPVRLGRVQGSVLYDVELLGPATLPPGRRAGRLPIEIGPGNRCDEHAIGQATRPFDFVVQVRIGAADPLAVSITPPLRGQVEVTSMLKRVCRARSG